MKTIILCLVALGFLQLAQAGVTWKAIHYFVSFLDGEQMCESKGGRLASIESRETEIAIQRYINTTSDLIEQERSFSFWIGRNDMVQEGRWVNIDGSVSNNHGWCDGEPNNNGNQDCGIYSMKLLCIDDIQCGFNYVYPIYPLCEFRT